MPPEAASERGRRGATTHRPTLRTASGGCGHPGHLKRLEAWMKSYKPEELFDERGKVSSELAELAPEGGRRMGAKTLIANGGSCCAICECPSSLCMRSMSLRRDRSGGRHAGCSKIPARRRDAQRDQKNSGFSGPNETLSNRLSALFEVTNRQWLAGEVKNDELPRARGRVMEMLSEASVRGLAGGYLLTGVTACSQL